jgi:ERF superfamily
MNRDDNDAALAHQQQQESEQMNKISAALVRAQKAFSPALKTSTNPHFKNRYAALDACVEAVMGALNDNGIFLMQRTYNSDNGVTVETVFIHESGEQMSGGMFHVPASKQDAQGYGSALTYARRFSIMAACGIAPEDDDGQAASKQKANYPTYNIAHAHEALTECESLESLRDTFARYYKLAPQVHKASVKEIYDSLKSKFESEDSITPTQGE